MIIHAIIMAVLGCIDALVSLFPSWSMSDVISNNGALSWAAAMENLFPVSAILMSLSLILLVKTALSVWGLGVWVYHQFWGSGT